MPSISSITNGNFVRWATISLDRFGVFSRRRESASFAASLKARQLALDLPVITSMAPTCTSIAHASRINKLIATR